MFVADGQGIAAARAALQWDPVQAAATRQPVIVAYIAGSPQSAAFMTEWDSWRASGATIIAVYVQHGPGSSAQRASADRRSVETRLGTDDDDGAECALLPEHDRCAAQRNSRIRECERPVFSCASQLHRLECWAFLWQESRVHLELLLNRRTLRCLVQGDPTPGRVAIGGWKDLADIGATHG
jgi:hypothetical protein